MVARAVLVAVLTKELHSGNEVFLRVELQRSEQMTLFAVELNWTNWFWNTTKINKVLDLLFDYELNSLILPAVVELIRDCFRNLLVLGCVSRLLLCHLKLINDYVFPQPDKLICSKIWRDWSATGITICNRMFQFTNKSSCCQSPLRWPSPQIKLCVSK